MSAWRASKGGPDEGANRLLAKSTKARTQVENAMVEALEIKDGAERIREQCEALDLLGEAAYAAGVVADAQEAHGALVAALEKCTRMHGSAALLARH